MTLWKIYDVHLPHLFYYIWLTNEEVSSYRRRGFEVDKYKFTITHG